MIAEIMFVLTIGTALFTGLVTGIVCIFEAIGEHIIMPVMEFILHLFGM